MKTKVFIIILNYERYQDTIRCIKYLKNSDLPANTQIVIIDNSITDTSQGILKKKFPRYKFIKPQKNLGFANGNNYGIRYALKNQATHIMIINPDVIVPKKFLPSLLLVFNQQKKAGLVAPVHQHIQKGQTFYGLGGQVDKLTTKCEHINKKRITFANPKQYQFVSFACVLIKRKVFETIGLLNDHYFMYLEDVDFCLTANQAGFTCFIDPKVKILHHTSSSFKVPTQKLKFSFISQLKFIRRWQKFPINLYSYLYMLLFYPYLYFLWTYQFHKKQILKKHQKTAKRPA